MKVNIFIRTRSGGKFTDYSLPHSSILGEEINGPEAFEDRIITEIDESRMAPEKVLATRFLAFLETRYLTVEMLNMLNIEEQSRLKKEFIEKS